MNKITSPHNPKVREALKLHNKKYSNEKGLFLIPHFRLINDAYFGRYEIQVIFSLDKSYSEAVTICQNVIIINYVIMKRLVPNYTHCQMVAVCSVKRTFIDTTKNILLLDNLQDPGNLGTLIRSAVSFGFNNILLVNNCTNVYSMKVIKASQGAVFHANILVVNDEVVDFAPWKKHGYKIVGTTHKLTVNFKVPTNPADRLKIVLCLGNEGNGLSDIVLKNVDYNWWLPLNKNIESLNVAIAGSILFYLYDK